jgi:hypothetical protein
MSTCLCLLRAFGRYSNFAWVVMVCLGTLAHGPVSLVMRGYAGFVVLAAWVISNTQFLSALIFNLLGINFQDYSEF